MIQPFILFEERFIPKLLNLRKTLLVTQSYPRAQQLLESSGKVCILVTDYSNAGLAKIHANAVAADRYGSIINLESPAHRAKLISMLSEGSGYRVFWSVLRSNKDVELLKTKIARKYRWNIKNYITNKTNWEISKDSAVNASVELVFGELYIILKHRSERIRLKLEEIESS